MFILRRVTSESRESNTLLGKEYHFLTKQGHPDEFNLTYASLLGEDTLVSSEDFSKMVEEDVYGFVIHNNGRDVITLWKKSQYYIMMSDGNTFANITFK